jgi:alginate O-acetyltransferase complex protein AlgI
VTAGFRFLKAMAGFAQGAGVEFRAAQFLDTRIVLAIGIGILASLPLLPALRRRLARVAAERPERGEALRRALALGSVVAVGALLVVSSMFIASGTYNPFLYFKF